MWRFIMSCHKHLRWRLSFPPRFSSKCMKTNDHFLYVKSNRVHSIICFLRGPLDIFCMHMLGFWDFDWVTGRKSVLSEVMEWHVRTWLHIGIQFFSTHICSNIYLESYVQSAVLSSADHELLTSSISTFTLSASSICFLDADSYVCGSMSSTNLRSCWFWVFILRLW